MRGVNTGICKRLSINPMFEIAVRHKGDADPAVAEKLTHEKSKLGALASVYSSLGRRNDADAVLRQLKSKFVDLNLLDIAAIHAYRGESDIAIVWLERAAQDEPAGVTLACSRLSPETRAWQRADYARALSRTRVAGRWVRRCPDDTRLTDPGSAVRFTLSYAGVTHDLWYPLR